MKEKIGFGIIILIAIVSIFLLSTYKKDKNEIEYLSYGKIEETLKQQDLAIVYFGELTDEKEENLRNAIGDHNIKLYTSEASLDDINMILIVNAMTSDTTDVYILFINADPVGYVVGTSTKRVLKETINELFFNEIPSSKIAYTIPNINDYLKKIKGKNYTVTVFGMNDCIHCDKYLPTINKIATDYKLEIFYINKNTYDKDDYNEIMKLNFSIPGRCTMDGKDTTYTDGFPKPMTIISKNGKFVDCIKGNVKESVVIETFQKYGIIKRD